MIRIYAIIGLAVSLLVGGLFLWGQQGHQEAARALVEKQVIATQLDTAKSALKAANDAAARNRKIAEARLAVAEKQRKAAESREKALRDAYKDNPQWAAAPVPDSVWNALGYPPSP